MSTSLVASGSLAALVPSEGAATASGSLAGFAAADPVAGSAAVAAGSSVGRVSLASGASGASAVSGTSATAVATAARSGSWLGVGASASGRAVPSCCSSVNGQISPVGEVPRHDNDLGSAQAGSETISSGPWLIRPRSAPFVASWLDVSSAVCLWGRESLAQAFSRLQSADCARIAREAGVPLKQVQAIAMKSYLDKGYAE